MTKSINEKWSDKYKRSINCSNPKGFSQKAHCAGRKKTNEDSSDWEFKNIDKLDYVLMSLCKMIVQAQKINSDLGMVAACVIDTEDRRVMGINYPDNEGKRVHAERAAIENYTKQYGEIPAGSIIVTTLSPCTDDEMHERHGDSCASLISDTNVHKVYCGYMDPSQQDVDRDYNLMVTENQKMQALCKDFADTFLDEGRKRKKKTTSRVSPYYVGYGWYGHHDSTEAGDAGGIGENFADGKKPGRKGLAKRVGVNCKQPVSKLRSIAKNSTGEKQRMAHWGANMKSGKKK
jgi:pyrimidine deaminase RibD-like protein